MYPRNRLKNSLIIKPVVSLFVFLAGVTVASLTMAQEQIADKAKILNSFDLRQALPSEPDGWKIGREDQVFTRDDIFDYLDGGGEIYLAYDFQFVFVREYVRDGEPSIVVEIYQMSSSNDAYGVFTHDLDGDEVELGQGAIYAAGLLRFWKDKVFVRIMADRETQQARAAVMGLGGKIAGAIPGEGEEPALIKFLPKEGLKPKSLRYFHTLISLNAHFYLANANILNLSPETQVVMARYQREGSQARGLLVEYPSVERAEDAEGRFTEMFLLERFEAGRKVPPKKLEDGRFAGVERKGQYLIIVIEADKKSDLDWITKTISRNLEGQRP
jgi:Family of unknown function (DUF6599)